MYEKSTLFVSQTEKSVGHVPFTHNGPYGKFVENKAVAEEPEGLPLSLSPRPPDED